jgi:hypothetical protein
MANDEIGKSGLETAHKHPEFVFTVENLSGCEIGHLNVVGGEMYHFFKLVFAEQVVCLAADGSIIV